MRLLIERLGSNWSIRGSELKFIWRKYTEWHMLEQKIVTMIVDLSSHLIWLGTTGLSAYFSILRYGAAQSGRAVDQIQTHKSSVHGQTQTSNSYLLARMVEIMKGISTICTIQIITKYERANRKPSHPKWSDHRDFRISVSGLSVFWKVIRVLPRHSQKA